MDEHKHFFVEDDIIAREDVRKLKVVDPELLKKKLYEDPEPCCHGVRKEDAFRIIDECSFFINFASLEEKNG
jgi:hypothetical protein